MTKRWRCDIIHKLSEREGSDRSLKIEQQERSTKLIEKILGRTTELENSFIEREGKLLTKKPRIKVTLNRGSDAAKAARLYKNLESLILAQDERWRRA